MDEQPQPAEVRCTARERGTAHVCNQPLGRAKSGSWGHRSMPHPWWPHTPKPRVVHV